MRLLWLAALSTGSKKFGGQVLSLSGLSSACSTATSCLSSSLHLKHGISAKNKRREFSLLKTHAYVDFLASTGTRRQQTSTLETSQVNRPSSRPYEGVDGATSDTCCAWMIPESSNLHFSGYLKALATEEDSNIHSVVPTTTTCGSFTPQHSRSGKTSS